MAAKVVSLPKIANPNIGDELQRFLDETPPKGKPARTDREMVIELFVDCINGYGPQWLSKEEYRTFDKYYNMEGSRHKDFCEIFGPEKIGENIGPFVDDFLVRKVMSSETFLRKAGNTMKALSEWLQANGYLEGDCAAVAIKRSTNAAKNLPRAEKAGRLLWTQIRATYGLFGSSKVSESGYMDITKIMDGKLWVRPIGGKEIGPIDVNPKVTELLEVGWEINLGLVKEGGKWEIAELGSIYPH
jgi:hypothetical protein